MKLTKITFIFCIFVFCSTVLAQQTKTQQNVPPKKIDTKISEQKPPEEPPSKPVSNAMLLLSGGYFKALGTESTMLDPSWVIKIMLKQDNIENTLFGFGGDILYTRLPDNTYTNAYIIYSTVLPYVTVTIPLYKSIMLQAKAGPGFTVLYSKINEVSDSSLSMTLAGGGGMYGIIKQYYILGIEAMYCYYFQIHASSSVSLYGYAGYMF